MGNFYARHEKLQKYFLGEPFIPEEFKEGEIIEYGEFENLEECETGIRYRWKEVEGEYICENHSKYAKEIKEYSKDKGETWLPVEPKEERKGKLLANEYHNFECLEIPSHGIFDIPILVNKAQSDRCMRYNEDGTYEQFKLNDDELSYDILKDARYGFFTGDELAEIKYMYYGFDFSNFNSSSLKYAKYMFNHCPHLTILKNFKNLDFSRVTDMTAMFYLCTSLPEIDLSNFKTDNVLDMELMFYKCEALKSLDLSTFNTSKVTDMSAMLEGLKNCTEIDVSSFDTTNVTTMDSMFSQNPLIERYNLKFNLENCTTTERMFSDNTNLKEVTFDTTTEAPLLQNMSYMFKNNANLELINLSGVSITSENLFMIETFCENNNLKTLLLNISSPKVVSIRKAFYHCRNLTEIDLSNTEMYEITDMTSAFTGCTSLEKLYFAKGFDSSSLFWNGIGHCENMFSNCPKLNYIKCTESFQEWCFKNEEEISLPDVMRQGGSGIWEIIL